MLRLELITWLFIYLFSYYIFVKLFGIYLPLYEKYV